MSDTILSTWTVTLDPGSADWEEPPPPVTYRLCRSGPDGFHYYWMERESHDRRGRPYWETVCDTDILCDRLAELDLLPEG